MSFEHISRPMTRVIDKLSDAYCIRLLAAMREHDFDVADEGLPTKGLDLHHSAFWPSGLIQLRHDFPLQ